MSSTAESPSRSGNAFTAFLARRWLSILLIALAVVFVVQNRDDVPVNFFTLTFTAPLWVTLTAVLLVGVVAGAVRAQRRHRRLTS